MQALEGLTGQELAAVFRDYNPGVECKASHLRGMDMPTYQTGRPVVLWADPE